MPSSNKKQETKMVIAKQYQSKDFLSNHAKIGICISGFMRTFEKCSPSVNKCLILPNLQHGIKMSIATWDLRGKGSCGNQRLDKNDFIPIKNIHSYYQCPMDIVAYSQEKSFIPLAKQGKLMKKHYPLLERAHYQWKMIQISFDMMKPYYPEILIRLRSDLLFEQPFKLKNEKNQWILETGDRKGPRTILLKNNTIVLSYSVIHKGTFNDMFAIGKFTAMRIYFRIYDYVTKKYINAHDAPEEGVPEKVMQYHLQKNGLNVYALDERIFRVIRD